MPINLSKGQTINLSKNSPINLEKKADYLDYLHIGLGWDVKSGSGNFDLDAMAACQTESGSWDKNYSCNYSHLDTPNGALHHCGDNLTGEGEGDDEVLQIRLSKLPAAINLVQFKVVIYDAVKRKQHFGQVENAFIRLVNMSNHEEICRYTLGKEFDLCTSVVMGCVKRGSNREWEFVAEGKPVGAKLDPAQLQQGGCSIS
uniref:TerD domain-containing protein n=1 Tax=Vannella robusta TaxID=1487602 RepID=A0A7S4I3N3_9EUKA|mmetsp:Transcript_19992/g.25279  ORF Transcript_19992/g.25279 Transcript_19992/m.25279 type:complete len:201 (+) Transcript_19992:1541-2143(+)|eukprot:CAMPEP_0206186362 /NCGR_PEP_ID=MMETSP0166-20121206/2361_1 /ASSEMBLY_ACC=CAM_ASM_000260 /TAXON_ID=95228 /ORGANISM="Vannella robusta, Strain DIVA3 518/3/11/1/6" /LENGTH=200 /DNA_ID=CAMNT_0053601739 /DNA_START=1279 /DNA_END=1881 /DNA_ORIENTATION=+